MSQNNTAPSASRLGNMLKSRTFHTLLGMAVSAGLLLFISLKIEWAELARHLREIHVWALLPCTALFCAHYAIRAIRWRYLLPAPEKVRFVDLFDGIMVGNFFTYILPLRAGEFVRPYLLTRHTNHSFSTCFVSVVVERFFDLAVVLLSFAAMVFYVPGIPEEAYWGAMALSGLAAGILLFLIIGGLFPGTMEKLIDFFIRPMPSKMAAVIGRFLKDFLHGALVLRSVKNLVVIVALSAAVWASCYLLFYINFYFLDAAPSAWLAVSVAVIVALAVAAPSAPGFVGIYQGGCVAAFKLFGLSYELGFAYSLITHFYQFMFFIAYGFFYLFRTNLRFSEIKRAAMKR